MKKRKTNYPLVIVLSTVSTMLPIVGLVYMVYSLFFCDFDTLFTLFGCSFTLPILLFFISFFQWIILRKPLKALYNKAIIDNEYDEFGRSKKKSFENLTRKEREALDVEKTFQMEQLLSSSVLKKIIKKGSADPENDLNSLIGMQSVKDKVTEMSARMKFDKETSKKSKKSEYGANGRHYVFYGSAGTGKTTVARIITGYLYKYGYIKQNKCVEIDGNFLKAGEMTDTKTKLLIQQAYGGVLFIDEAYTIVDGGVYGKAAIATLIKEMEDNRDKFTVILAGYKNDMKRLLDTNEGFKSRIKEYISFPDYNVEEMKDIFISMAHSAGFVVSDEALENFEIRCDKEKKLPSFGNGRTVRNILDEVIDKHALNYEKGLLTPKKPPAGKSGGKGKNADNRYVLCGCDVSLSANRNVL